MSEIHFERVGNFPPAAILSAKLAATHEIMAFTVPLWSGKRSIGSGTLVASGNFFGILTAHHVSSAWRNDEPLVLNIAEHDHQFFIEPRFIEHFVVGPWDERRPPNVGPDLALFRITDLEKLGTLKSKKNFLRLDTRSAEEVFGRPLADMQWWVAGAPHEMKIEPQAESGITPGETIFHGEAEFKRIYHEHGFDYVETELLSGSDGFPMTYKGVSGGGIWLFMFTLTNPQDRSSVSFQPPILAGVAFCQGDWIDGRRSIFGHGPESIYGRVREVLERHA